MCIIITGLFTHSTTSIFPLHAHNILLLQPLRVSTALNVHKEQHPYKGGTNKQQWSDHGM